MERKQLSVQCIITKTTCFPTLSIQIKMPNFGKINLLALECLLTFVSNTSIAKLKLNVLLMIKLC